MTIITKGMGAIITRGMGAITKLKKSRKVSDLKKTGKTFRTQNVTYGPDGRKRTNYRYVGGPLTGFSTKPYMPKKSGQGKLFREKFEKPKKNPKQLKFKFKDIRKVDPEKKLKTAIKRAEVK